MITATVTGETNFAAKLKLLTPAIRAEEKKTVLALTFQVANEVKKEFYTAGLHRRTGALLQSIKSGGVTEDGNSMVGSTLIGQGLPYPRAQEYGATITPTKTQFLAIPLDAAKTPAGVARFAPRDATSAGYSSTFIRNHIIFGVKGHETVPLFKLVRSVTIPARPFARPAFKRMQPTIEKEIEAALVRGARKVI